MRTIERTPFAAGGTEIVRLRPAGKLAPARLPQPTLPKRLQSWYLDQIQVSEQNHSWERRVLGVLWFCSWASVLAALVSVFWGTH